MNIKRKSGEIWAQSWIIMIIIGGKKKKKKMLERDPEKKEDQSCLYRLRP